MYTLYLGKLINDSIFSTQRILHNARLTEQGLIKGDVLNESIGLQLHMINILWVPRLHFCSQALTISYLASAWFKFWA